MKKEGEKGKKERVPFSRVGLSLYSMEGIGGFAESKIVAVSGRPIAEFFADSQTLQRAQNSGILFELPPTKLTGSREGTTTNISAFEDLRPRFPALLDNMAWIHDQYEQVHPQDISKIANGVQARDKIVELLLV